MLENVRLAFQGIWSHKMRSFLTMLGIIIGIAAIIAIVSTIKGTNDQIKESLIGSGSNTVKVTLYQGSIEYSGDDYYGSSSTVQVQEISEDTCQEITDLPEVESVTTYLSKSVYDGIFYGNESITDLYVYGIDMDYFSTCNYVIRSGRTFLQADHDQYRSVVILDKNAATGLFGDEDPLGKTIEISSMPFVVVGVAEEQSSYTPTINSISDYYQYQDDSNGTVFLPKAVWPVIYKYDEAENMVLKAVNTDSMTKAGQKAANILNETISSLNTNVSSSNTLKYKAEDLLGQASKMQEYENTTNVLLLWVAGISLLVGGIGVMNIMLVSVTERTNEIGLKKAIGARKSAILAQFLTEAAVLTSMGGILGVIAGVGASQVVHKVSEVPVSIDIPASVIAVAFSMVIGLIFGFLPSVQASNLDPIDALRHE